MSPGQWPWLDSRCLPVFLVSESANWLEQAEQHWLPLTWLSCECQALMVLQTASCCRL